MQANAAALCPSDRCAALTWDVWLQVEGLANQNQLNTKEALVQYRLTRSVPFGTALDEDGRTVLGASVTVPAGSVVEHLTIGALDMALVTFTDPHNQVCYGWVFLSDLEDVKK
jgi:hypothetical protein